MNELGRDDARNHSEVAEDVFDFGSPLLDHVLWANHQFKKQSGFLVVVFAAIKNAKQRQLVKVVHILRVLLEKLHPQAAVQHRVRPLPIILLRELENALYHIAGHKPARNLV